MSKVRKEKRRRFKLVGMMTYELGSEMYLTIWDEGVGEEVSLEDLWEETLETNGQRFLGRDPRGPYPKKKLL